MGNFIMTMVILPKSQPMAIELKVPLKTVKTTPISTENVLQMFGLLSSTKMEKNYPTKF